MRIVQFLRNGEKISRLGVELSPGGNIADLTAANPSLPSSSVQFISQGKSALDKAKTIVSNGQNVIDRKNVKLLAPITNPDKVICIGMNYKDHCEEQNAPVPKEPVVFNKFPSTIIGPYDDIQYPQESKALDWEVELAIVIGKTGKNIKAEEVDDFIFGYTVCHDVSARDCQMEGNGGQWLLGKSMDTFCPLGPAIVTKDELDPFNLKLTTRVNGVVKQNSKTDQVVHKATSLLPYLSRFFTLRPGDVILTGTPPGVGCFRKPPEFLKVGDIVECEIENIGLIKNKIV